MAERHRLIFYAGHLEAFDWNLIGRDGLGCASFHPTFDKLFAFGIDPEIGGGPADQASDWPRWEEVRRYVGEVRARLDRLIDRATNQYLNVALEHRWMHAETLAYLFHNLPREAKCGPDPLPAGEREAPANRWVPVESGPARMGLEREGGFGWDNEFEGHTVNVDGFRISRFKVSNGEYLEYVRQGAKAPYFWTQRRGEWILRLMFGEIRLPLDWPVYVTHEEAEAFARWRGAGLPTEAQYQRAAEGARGVNADFASWDPVAVDVRGGVSKHGVEQLIGNGWEWTSTVFGPFPGFEPFPFYRGYSADFFDGRHWVMKGGSARTAGCLLRPTFRNWFRGDYPYVYSGFRLVEKAP